MRKNNAFRRAAALMAALSITVSLAAPAFAKDYYLDDGDITITKNENGSQTVQQGSSAAENIGADEEIIISNSRPTRSLESDLEGPAAEDSGFGPVVEDNYQPAQPEDAEEPKDANQPEGADQPESAEEPKSADQHESAEQAAAGFLQKTITVINKAVDTVLNLTLKDVKIDVSGTGSPTAGTSGKAALSVQGSGNVEIELDGNNELKSGYKKAGLEKNTSAGKLTLKDDNNEAGSLKATGGQFGAGIGGGAGGSGKNITINGGEVKATGGYGGAGIGGGHNGDGRDIAITGSTVTATGGKYGAGIGGGQSGNGNNITINGGTVNATGGYDGAGIGGGWVGRGENITIAGGTVTVAGGDSGAGIGGGYQSSGENITITGGTVNATGGSGGAGIGGGHDGSLDGSGNGGDGKNITITGGTVNANGGQSGAGIGGGHQGSGKNITINGGTVTATGGRYAAGIGGSSNGDGKNITIKGGTVTATGGDWGAGIGGGDNSSGGNCGNGENITITGGTVNATGGDRGGAGIGGGANGSGSNVTVSGAAQVTTTTTASKSNYSCGTGATIGNGGKKTPDGPADGEEIQAKIDDLLPGYIHHIIYNPDGTTIKREWWEPERPQPNPQPNPGGPNGNEVNLGTPFLHVETLKGDLLPFNARKQGSTLRVTTDNLAARLHGTRQALETLQEQGVEQIQFVTTLKTTTLSVAELLAEGGSWFALEHNGLVSRRLSAAQAESLKCQMRQMR